MNKELLDKIAEVARLRNERKTLASRADASRERWEDENARLLNDLKDATLAQQIAEGDLRAWTVSLYRETGSKRPGPGLGIRVVNKVTCSNGASVHYCIEHNLAHLLDVRAKAFEKYALDLAMTEYALDFVTISEEPQATLAADLDAALKEAEGDA